MSDLLRRVAVLALLGILLAACGWFMSSAEKDRRNEELMESLPVYPGATLVMTWTSESGGGFRHLHYYYAADAEPTVIQESYIETLTGLGWEIDDPPDEVHVSFVSERGSIFWDNFYDQPPGTRGGERATPVALPPPVTLSFFEITVHAGK